MSQMMTNYNVNGFTLHMTFTDVDTVVEAVKKTGIHNADDRAQIAIAVYVAQYANSASSVGVFLATLTQK